jgi:hypothetical protein
LGPLRRALLRGGPGHRHQRCQTSPAFGEGFTENATLVTELLVGLRERGLDVTRPILTVIDGINALHCVVLDVFDPPVIASPALSPVFRACGVSNG